MVDGRGAQAIEFVECAIYGGVGYEVESLVVVGGGAGGFVDEWGGTGEGVVYGSDELGV